MIKKQLKALGVGEKIFNDLLQIAIEHVDGICLLNNNKPVMPVSYALNYHYRFSDKIYKLFIKYEIYNILYLNVQVGKHTFKCKYRSGNIAEYVVDKKDCKSVKIAFSQALLYFINDPNKNEFQVS